MVKSKYWRLAHLLVAGLWLGGEPSQAQTTTCKTSKSGLISAGTSDADRKNKGLHGPFLIVMLQTAADPALAQRSWVMWTKKNVWLSVDEFHGPFYLAKDEYLVGDSDYTSGGVVYSGFSCSGNN